MRKTVPAFVAVSLAGAAAVTMASASLDSNARPAQPSAQDTRGVTYRITGDLAAARTAISAADVDYESMGKTEAIATGPQSEMDKLSAAGLKLTPTKSFVDAANERVDAALKSEGAARADTRDFPRGDEAYHTYDEMQAELAKTTQAYPDMARTQSIGKTFEGRDITVMRLGKAQEGAPEVFINCNIHAREHLTTEQCLYLINELTSKYKSDSRVKNIMDNRIIWVSPIANPDGSTFDVASGKYAGWRKTRSRNSDGSIGVDPNRNFGYKWNCCNGSSGTPKSDSYRGPRAFSEKETAAIRDFFESRKVGGEQRIKAFMDIHTFGQLVMWPFGYTQKAVVPDMTQDQYDMLKALGTKIAGFNGYKAEQSATQYVTDGDTGDWGWGGARVPTIVMELYPGEGAGGGLKGFYPPASVIPRETQRNRETLLTFIELADCQYKLTGKEAQYCKSAKPTPTPTPTPDPTDPPANPGDDWGTPM